ncbi:hemolysin family protein [Propionimicrobium lymphophilum]|uniref:hemolysin family protein n=1 Tax=Propionimicrobium lymphophilum TaxID=33012 RepID=UPI003EC7F0D0
MSDLWVSIGVIFLLFFIGGIFSASEMALVTLRDSQIRKLSHKGKRGKAIEKLTSDQNRFLSSVQIGVTVAGFLSSAFGSDSLANKYLGPWLDSMGVPASNAIAIIAVTAMISFLSIVLSELTAKRLALQNTEQFSLALAPLVDAIATICRPLIWLLGKCTNVMVRVFGGDPNAGKESVSEEELRSMVASAESLGIDERRIVDDVFDAGDRSLREVMVPRTEVDFLDGNESAEDIIDVVVDREHSRYPVIIGSPDQVVGFLHVRDLMKLDEKQLKDPILTLVRPVKSLPATVRVLVALRTLQRENAHLAIVLDEYGGTAGLVTIEDLIEELIGEITDEYDVVDAEYAQHLDQHDLEGLTSLEDFEERAHLVLPEGPYDTVAGYFMAQIGRLPELGDEIFSRLRPSGPLGEEEGNEVPVKFTVIEMDGRRASWLRMRRIVAGDSAGSTNEQVVISDAKSRNDLAAFQHSEDVTRSEDS